MPKWGLRRSEFTRVFYLDVKDTPILGIFSDQILLVGNRRGEVIGKGEDYEIGSQWE